MFSQTLTEECFPEEVGEEDFDKFLAELKPWNDFKNILEYRKTDSDATFW